jgi:glycosyltransferase involved in cell wall biosynthesis
VTGGVSRRAISADRGREEGPTLKERSGRPRLLFVGPRPESPGGIAQFQSNLVRAVARDADASILAFRRLYPKWTKPGRLGPDPTAAPVDIESSAVLVPWRPWTWRSGVRHIQEARPDLVVVQWWHPVLGPCLRYLSVRARRRGTRVVYVCHNGRPHERFPFSRTLSRRALRSADELLALSGPVASELRSLAPAAPIEVLAHPPNLTAGTLATGRSAWKDRIGPVDGPVVLFFGHVRRYKGLEDLIAAMQRVRFDVPATLVVAGRFFTPLRKIRAVVERCRVRDAVKLHPGFVRGDEVADLFSCADVVALPYREASQSGIVAQAALFGKPVVATAVGGLVEAVGDRGILVPPADPVALAAGIVRALHDPPPPPALPSVDWDEWRRILLELAGRTPLRVVGIGEAS